MNRIQKVIILVNLLIVLGLLGNSVFKKEQLLSDGTMILLELAPVDPRSLIQGDYMRLRYGISGDIDYDSITKTGFCVVTLNADNTVDQFRIQEKKSPLEANEHLINYTKKRWNDINIGAESYFFQEGEGEKYENAKYGGVKVDGNGNSLLVGLYDEDKNLIE
ncbi:GDYXXLXY domain-containing protein [Flagellimonas myxillae]|uniref:GDYXXLXY domain-containing protein n=1 Tax=Flagellimonas myxillae TaxID=2942214 RepID=UPI00201F4764|nr:GDYXXLXY domain-containing protein [Muricauda myxillae]MCL6266608.1 GDYXXLXY domain-containing protein [Muricauda myxillae]